VFDRKSNMAQRTKQILAIVLAIVFCLLFAAIAFCLPFAKVAIEVNNSFAHVPPNWDLQDIKEYMAEQDHVTFPPDATGISYKVGPQYGFYLKLDFKAPSQSASIFLQNICDGILYQGYDPFHANSTGQPSPEAYLIRIWPYYYSYSPNTPDTFFGNQCDWVTQVLVDKTDPNLYAIRYEKQMSCYPSQATLCISPYSEYARPINDFDAAIIGIEVSHSGKDVWLVARELCIQTRSMYPDNNLIQAEIQIKVDGKPMPDAYVSKDMSLFPEQDEQGKRIADKRGKTPYCLKNTWSNGLHTMDISVTTKHESSISYRWQFQVGAVF
jgi:hypothetical protein